MSNFVVGDKVRHNTDKGAGVGKILSFDSGKAFPYEVEWSGLDGHTVFHSSRNLVLNGTRFFVYEAGARGTGAKVSAETAEEAATEWANSLKSPLNAYSRVVVEWDTPQGKATANINLERSVSYTVRRNG